MSDIKNKVVWITGASSGIGEQLAYELARKGAYPVLSARNQDKLKQVQTKCLEFTENCWIQPMDLSKVNELSTCVDRVIEQTEGVDILINNAGQSQRSLAKNTSLDIDRKIMELNFFGVVALTKLVLPHMIKKKQGHLVVVSSISGKFGFPWRTAYSASKHAVQGYFESLRAELVKDHIKVCIVSPGRIQTNISMNAMIENGERYNQMDAGQANGMSAEKCAQKMVRAIEKDRKELLVGNKELLMVYIRKFLPALYHKLVTRISN